MNRQNLKLFLFALALVFGLGCATSTKIEYQLVKSPDPSLRVVRILQNSQIGSSRTGSSSGFFFNPTHIIKDGKNFKTVSELLSFLEITRKEHPVDALVIMVMVGPIQMYSASDIQMRNEAIKACSDIGIKVLVQEVGGQENRYFSAVPLPSRPNP